MGEEPSPTKSNRSTKTQWIAATEVLLLLLMMGANYGWISPFLGKLVRPDPPFEATKEQTTWIASLVSMSRPVGIIAGTATTNYLGTKTSLYICGFYYVGAWLSLILADSIYIVFINQVFCGLGMGTLYTIYPLFLSEIVDAKIRATVISYVIHGMMIGVLFGNLMGSYVEPRTFGVINLAIALIYLVTFYFLPSSPHYLVNSNKLEEAEKALSYYRGTANVKQELAQLQLFLNSSPRVPFLQTLRKLKDPVNLRTLIMINIVYSLVQFSGTYAIMEYLEIIFIATKIEIILPSTLVTIMSAMTIPACWLAMAVSDRFGRVSTLVFSCVVFCIAFLGLGLNFQLLELGYRASELQWLVIISALLYRVNLTAGLTSTVPVLISEVFAPNIKSVAAGICNIVSSLCIFISSKNFQMMVDQMTYKYVFYLFAALVVVVGIYTKLCIPETRGKTLQEIQDIFLKKSPTAPGPEEPTHVYVNTICEQPGDETSNASGTTKL